MLKKELIQKNPLRILYPAGEGIPTAPRMGLVMARAGLGKTAILVQIALDSLLCGNNVLHVSIGQKLEKTKAWYDDIFHDIAKDYKLENASQIHDEISRRRLIMTFHESSFNRAKLEERLNDLIYQNIFRPDCIVIDGFDFASTDRQALADIRELMEGMQIMVWFTALSHRDDVPGAIEGVPASMGEFSDLFDTVILLQPAADEKCITLNTVKDTIADGEVGLKIKLDPATLMLRETHDENC